MRGGRKYKNCCLRRASPQPASAAEFLRHRIHRATDGLPLALLKFAERQFDGTLIEEAWTDFIDDEVPFDPGSPHLQVFMPWFFCQWSPDPDHSCFPDMAEGRATVASEYLATRARDSTRCSHATSQPAASAASASMRSSRSTRAAGFC